MVYTKGGGLEADATFDDFLYNQFVVGVANKTNLQSIPSKDEESGGLLLLRVSECYIAVNL